MSTSSGGRMIEFPGPDGQNVPGYLSEPKRAAPGVVVIQEVWGLTDQLKGVADRLAKAGTRALVPDFYRGKVGKTMDEARGILRALDRSRFLGDVRGAAQYLKAKSAKVGVMGFCMGGAVTIVAAEKVPEVDAAVCFYGIPGPGEGDPSRVRVPIQCHFAQHDDWCNPPAVDALEAQFRAGGVTYEIHRYDAKHAFFNETRPEAHEPASAKAAWERTLAFWKSRLG